MTIYLFIDSSHYLHTITHAHTCVCMCEFVRMCWYVLEKVISIFILLKALIQPLIFNRTNTSVYTHKHTHLNTHTHFSSFSLFLSLHTHPHMSTYTRMSAHT